MTTTLDIPAAVDLLAKAGRPFSGKLIAPPGDNAECPYCAQGIILSHTGTPDDELRRMGQSVADREVSARLGISRAEAVLLRRVNDSGPGLPQAVLHLTNAGIGSVIGGEWRLLVSFWRHLDMLAASDWERIRDAARDAAGDAARASYEIMGRSKLTSYYFLPRFGFPSPEAIPLHPAVRG